MSEKRKIQDPPHHRDWTVAEQPLASHRRINEAGDSVPSSQDSVTREVQNLHISNPPAVQTVLPTTAIVVSGEFKETAATETTGILRPPPHSTRGAKTRRTATFPESFGQLRHLDRAACMFCVRSQRCNRCCFCNSNTPLRELRVGDTFQDRRQPHQSAAPRGAPADQPSSGLTAGASR